MFNFYLNNNSKDWLDIVGIVGQILVPIIVLIISILYTNSRNNNLDKQFTQQLKQQKEQWLSDEFIKNEARKIIEFRDICFKSCDSAIWLINTLFSAQYLHGFYMDENNKYLLMDTINMHYKEAKKIPDFYFKNQMIFKKYGIGAEIEYISMILEIVAVSLKNSSDLIYSLFKENEQIKEYRHNKYKELIDFLVTGLDLQFSIIENSFSDENIKNEIINLNFDEKLNKYKNFIISKIIGLEFALEKLTLIDYENIPVTLKSISKRTIPDSLI